MHLPLRNLVIGNVLGVLLLAAGGCVIAGYAASIYGDPPIPAAYIPAKVPMLVIVKDPPDPSGTKIEADTVGREIEEQITRHDIAPLVPSAKVDEFRRTTLSGFGSLPPAQVGKAVGAEQVLYITILSSSIDSGSARDMLKGNISTSVCVIDVQSGKMLWPTDGSSGAAVGFTTPMVRIAGQTSPLTVSRGMYAGVADRIAKLFRKYKPDQE